MMQLIAGGLIGLALGGGLHLSRLCRGSDFPPRAAVRRLPVTLGLCVMLAALLLWLAVIDVDMLAILPLHAGLLLGGALWGAAAALTGVTAATALAGIGCGRLWESLCAVAGLAAGAFLLPVLEPLFRPLHNVLPLGAPLLFLFAAVAGFSPSVTRACIMCGLMMAAQLLNREYDGASALSAAVLTMLVCNPYSFSSVSFQLSVAGVAGILLFTPRILNAMIARLTGKKGKKYSFLRKLAAAVAVTAGAQVFTIPLCAWYFGMVSVVGVVTNLLVLWVISLIFCMLTAI